MKRPKNFVISAEMANFARQTSVTFYEQAFTTHYHPPAHNS